jgi:hypothetical protein
MASFRATGTFVPDGIISSFDFAEFSEFCFAACARESRNCGVSAVLLGIGALLWAAANAETTKTNTYFLKPHLHPKAQMRHFNATGLLME